MQIGLRRILLKTKPGYAVVSDLIQAFDTPLSILDEDGALLLASEDSEQGKQTAVMHGEYPAGWVVGPEPQSSAVARLLERLIVHEMEKQALSDELLDNYRELNLLYNFSEHLLATPEPAAIASTTLQEVGRLIRFTAAWVLLLDNDTQELGSIAGTDPSLTLKEDIGRDAFIAASLARYEAEIYNDVHDSQIFKDAHSRRIALLCAPLKTEQRALGVILLMGDPPINFTARHLKLLNTVALQAGPAIEMARLYQIALVQGRMERELQMAFEVQASLIPAESPSIPEEGWEFAGRWRPARELSGDYYDFIPLRQNTYGLVIADVADKGMPSALFMVNTRSAVRTAVHQADSPAAAISGANRLVSQEATDGLFVTLIYGQLNSRSGSLTYVNAGHNPALHYHGDNGTLTLLPRTGMPLGILATAGYTQQEIQIQPGDTIILYTDGVTEAMNLADEEFGLERLRAVILDHPSGSAEALAMAIETAVDQFAPSSPPFDDFTLMIIRRRSR